LLTIMAWTMVSLEAALRDAGLSTTRRLGSAYTLAANLQKLDQPFIGLDMAVTARVQYTLVERSNGKRSVPRN
jgi:hypothetical protein